MTVQGRPVRTTEQRVAHIAKRSWASFLLAILQLGCAISVILVTRYELEVILVSNVGRVGVAWAYTCFLSSNLSSWACQYAYALGAISLILSMAVFVTQCLECEDVMSRGARVFESSLDAFGFLWWLVGAIVLSVEHTQTKALGLPRQPARDGVLALCWISAGLFALLFVYNLATAAKIKKVVEGHGVKAAEVAQDAAV